jgi:hypothetical protein
LVDTIQYKGYTITTYYEEGPESPREWDNLGKMVLKHNRYNFPQDVSIDFDDFDNWQAIEKYLQKEYNAVIVLPVQMYEHGNIRIYVGSSHDTWDGGQLGLIFATAQDIRNTFMVKRITKEIKEKAIKNLESEVDTYSAYVDGQVYRYEVTDSNGNEVDSCGGFYGDSSYDYMVNECKAMIDCIENLAPSMRQKRVAPFASALHR